MKIRWAGLGLIGLGILFAVLFVYLLIRDGPDGFMGRVRLNALVFIPLAVVTGLAFVIGGTPVLEAFQARPKSRGQLALVLSILIGSFVLTGLGYWQIKTRWLRTPDPVILDSSPKVPDLPNVR
jgi:Ca2+/H+ antiporter